MSSGPHTIGVVTGSRADYGLLYWPMKAIAAEPTLMLQVIVTGQHLSPAFGSTVETVVADGFPVRERVEMLEPGDSRAAVTRSLGRGVIGFADAFERLQPDLVMVLGDRFEILAAAQAAMIAGIPLAHIAGGDITQGAFDDAIRHSITQMSQLHFVTNEVAARRVRQLGVAAERVHNVGSPGLDYIRHLQQVPRAQLERDLDFEFRPQNLLVSFHPVTRSRVPSAVQLEELLGALDRFGDLGILFTMPNSDPEGLSLYQMLQSFVASRPHTRLFQSLGSARYLSLMAEVQAVVGNSSSGLYEAPSLQKPSVNVGDRQQGRLRASSVIDCPAERTAIISAIEAALAGDFSGTVNPYGDGKSSARIVEVLRSIEDPRALLPSPFCDLAGVE